jgi:large subunit ribosomal protein L24
MATKMKIKKGDTVKIIAGDHRGEEGEVLAVLPKRGAVLVNEKNVATKTIKKDDNNPEGGFTMKEKPIDISNVRKV